MKGKILLIFVLLIIIIAVLWTFWPKPKPTVAMSKVYDVTQPGATTQVNITISDVSDLSGWAIDLTWDPHILQVTTGDPNGTRPLGSRTYYNIYEGPFLESIRPTSWLVNQVDNETGKIKFLSAIYTGAGETPSGSGVLATINFTCINVGTTTIEGKSIIQDRNGNAMSHEISNGLITDQSYAPPPIWTSLSFQASTIIIEAVVLAVASFVIIRKRRVSQASKSQRIPE